MGGTCRIENASAVADALFAASTITCFKILHLNTVYIPAVIVEPTLSEQKTHG